LESLSKRLPLSMRETCWVQRIEALSCSHCGAPLVEDQEQCSYCGSHFKATIKAVKATNEPEPIDLELLADHRWGSPISDTADRGPPSFPEIVFFTAMFCTIGFLIGWLYTIQAWRYFGL